MPVDGILFQQVTVRKDTATETSGYKQNLSEMGYYHLKSRYYKPELCRFINADSVDVLDEDQNNVLENNLFAYCLNNPVNMVDYDGNSE